MDVILGYKWFKSLGKFKANLGEYLIEVEVEGGIVKVKGDPTLSR